MAAGSRGGPAADHGRHLSAPDASAVLQLQAEFGIATATAQKVHRALREEGLIYTEQGLGSFVADRPVEGRRTGGLGVRAGPSALWE